MVTIKLGRYEAELYSPVLIRINKIVPNLKNSSRQSYSKEFSSTETLNNEDKLEIFWCKG